MVEEYDGDLIEFSDRINEMRNHRVFTQIGNINQLKIFMEWHVFAVWDFMSIVKRLQNDFTCTRVPWVPRSTYRSARLINEIVLGEETDEIPGGVHLSHYDLYLAAMEEVAADSQQIRQFVSLVENGVPTSTALVEVSAPPPIRQFVTATMRVAEMGKIHQVLGNFFYGREDAIPQMFRSLLNSWALAPDDAPMFRYYLDRHIELDGENHGPAVKAIIYEVVKGDPVQMAELKSAALEAIEQRIALWDALSTHLQTIQQVLLPM
ncbi:MULTISPECIES: DUF3050 domain-containing protein [Burkholderia]|uniref:DUF3050 domain-containing protein n=1 Tax=Burkholderia TaxID=32008 RepID=UPI0008422685|nr:MULTISPECIES: DUF3050 domain-containing protein [unclassified Burkholderia]AOK32062.1 mangotoxin biosynthesis-involved protein MgoB [Burkholderia sp. Bp7605]